ncbi:MAG: molybdopterin cofactor-binding domain-containing protein [Gemmatimonadales bacterium]
MARRSGVGGRVAETDGKGSTTPRPKRALSRRAFVLVSAAAGGGLLLAFAALRKGRPARRSDGAFVPDGFIRIDRDGAVTLTMHKVEMGQGTYTSMPMLLAEELEVDLAHVRLEHAPANNDLYAEPMIGEQMTGGSTSVRGNWEPLRRAGAAARTLLIGAAAREWGVAPESCRASNGVVTHAATGRTLGYGALADAAAKLEAPRSVRLKGPREFRLIGTHVKRLDAPGKVDGSARFGCDVRLPGMKFAAVAACPVFGGTLSDVGPKIGVTGEIPGLRQLVRLRDAVAVVADDTWSALRGLAALDIRWNEGPNAGLTTAEVVRQLETASHKKGGVARRVGDAARAMAGASTRLEAVYEMPFLAHATMEPVNCTVHVRPELCEIWVGTQVPARARDEAARVLGVSPERVVVHNHLIGGGFGRRLEWDFIVRAVEIARQVDGPVQVFYSREEDIQHDMYRPYYYDRIAAGLDARGMPVAWTHRVVGPSIIARQFPPSLRDVGRTRRVAAAAIRQQGLMHVLGGSLSGMDDDAVEAAAEPPYDLPNMLVDYVRQEPPGIPTAWWRGVGPTANVFVVESFMDELASAAHRDPVDYRRALLTGSPRARAVLELAAERSGWGRPLPAGRARGVALLHAFGSFVAQVAEVSLEGGEVRVQRVTCAVDCGMVVNPDTVAAQMQGGIIFGLTAALFGEITIAKGRVEQTNFGDYRIMRLNEAPAVDVHIVPSGEAPGGIGEPGTSASMPALTNALFALTGTRIRRLPVKDQLEKLPRRDSNPRPAG